MNQQNRTIKRKLNIFDQLELFVEKLSLLRNALLSKEFKLNDQLDLAGNLGLPLISNQLFNLETDILGYLFELLVGASTAQLELSIDRMCTLANTMSLNVSKTELFFFR